MFIIHNITSKTIMIADLKAEIKPRGILDLEKVALRSAIEDSRDLKHALKTKQLQMGRHSVVKAKSSKSEQTPIVHETVVERELNEEKLAELIRGIVREEKINSTSRPDKTDENINEVIKKTVHSGMSELISSIRNQIGSIQPVDHNPVNEIPIDPAKFAEISQKNVEKISESIETSGPTKSKKLKFRDKNVQDLADEI